MTLSDFIMTRPINDGHRGLVLVVCFCPSVRLSVCLFQTSKKCSKLAHIRVSGGENLRSGGQRSISRGQITLTVTYTDRSPKNQHFDIMLLTGLYGVFCRDGDSQDHKVDSRDFEIWDLLATCHWRLKTYTWNLGPMTRDLIETEQQWFETWLDTWVQWLETWLRLDISDLRLDLRLGSNDSRPDWDWTAMIWDLTWDLVPMTRDLIKTKQQWFETWLETWVHWLET